VNQTVAHVFSEAVQTLWPFDGKFYMLLLVTDATQYMKKGAEGLSVSCPELKHVTCLLHAFHRVSEFMCLIQM
jgi:hypothetical protein